jgi:hypothetical protein
LDDVGGFPVKGPGNPLANRLTRGSDRIVGKVRIPFGGFFVAL